MELDETDIRSLMQAAGGRKDVIEGGRSDHPDGLARKRGGRTGGPRGANNGQRGKPPQPSSRNGNAGGKGQAEGRSAGKSQDRGDLRQGGAGQPDPMKTAFGYIGADSFTRQRQDAGQRPRNAQGGPRGGRRGR